MFEKTEPASLHQNLHREMSFRKIIQNLNLIDFKDNNTKISMIEKKLLNNPELLKELDSKEASILLRQAA